MSTNAFAALGVPMRLAEVLAGHDIVTPTPIQQVTLPDSLAGRDVLGRGRTGSGKTYAFLLPVLARLGAPDAARRPMRTAGAPRALVLVPTRELAVQIEAAAAPLAAALGLRTLTVFGGVGQGPQASRLRAGVDLLIACPGRLEDLVSQGVCRLGRVEVTVLDEADHMSDLGFLPAVRRLLDATPKGSQRLLFSATLDNAVDLLVRNYLRNPVTHQADSPRAAAPDVDHHVLHVASEHRLPVLVDLASGSRRTIVFTRTKHGARALARRLNAQGVPSVELHGNLAQPARTRNLAAFQAGTARTLVATDIAARGIHVDDIELVVHADPPAEFKAYVHRSGRTARAGAKGTVVTLTQHDQAREVAALTRAAGIRPTTTTVTVGHPLLRRLVPGERVLHLPIATADDSLASEGNSGGRAARGGGSRRGGASAARGGAGAGRGRARRSERRAEPGRRAESSRRGAVTGAPAGSTGTTGSTATGRTAPSGAVRLSERGGGRRRGR